MSDPNQRIISWQTETDTVRVKGILGALRPNVLKHCEAATVVMCEMETKARCCHSRATGPRAGCFLFVRGLMVIRCESLCDYVGSDTRQQSLRI
jgi:hypothetical protein